MLFKKNNQNLPLSFGPEYYGNSITAGVWIGILCME